MNEAIFGIENFNLISDDQYYYVFRALNMDDQKEIDEGITSENGVIQRVMTNKQRYPQNNKYADRTEISLQEVWDHTKSVEYYKGTNCISLSSNANVSIDYGSKYGQRYLMVKIPKAQKSDFYNAGQYMISELNRILDQRVKQLPQDSEIVKLIQEIEKMEDSRAVRQAVSDRFDRASTRGRFTSSASIKGKESLIQRFGNRQAFSEEQQLEYNKLLGKLTLLQISGNLPKQALNGINISYLMSTIGSEFSNREFVHYGEMSSDEFVPISKINLEMFALLQVAREQGINEQKLKEIENRLIEFTNQGYELIEINGNLYYANDKDKFDLGLNDNSILVRENELKDDTNLSIEEMFEKTNGSISYVKAQNAAKFVHNLCIAQRKSIELADVLNTIVNDSELAETINEIEHKAIAINDKIITRVNGRGTKVSESVNIDMNRGERKQFSDDEQKRIFETIKGLSAQDLDRIISNNASDLEQQIYMENLVHSDINTNKTREERLNRYFAETIVDALDTSTIYKKAVKDKGFTAEERENLVAKFENVDCQKLVNAFINAGVEQNELSGYIFNILASNGYKGYTIEELSKLDNLDEIIKTNIDNNNLKGHVYPSVLEEMRGITDNDNRVGNTLIKLRDYQKETVDNIDAIYAAGKRFAGVVLPTGAGKSFVAMTEMLKNQNANIVYIAPQQEILNQVQKHILKNIARVDVLTTYEIDKLKEEQKTANIKELKLPEGKILPSQANEYVKKVFPHLKMLCYQGLSERSDRELTDEQKYNRDSEERELKEILKNNDADLIVFDELHRSGAKTWKGVVEQLINSNEKSNILGITATPIRDADNVDMMKEMAEMTHTYTKDELATKQYLAYEMYLPDAIQRGLVVEPEIVSFDFMLRETDEYQHINEMIKNETDETKKKQLLEIKAQIDELLSGDTPITEHIKSNISQKENEEIGKIINNTIKKKDGRYIVFLPQHNQVDGLSETEYFEQQEQKIREMLSGVDSEAEIYRLSSADSKAKNYKSLTDFENSPSNHLKVMLAINKLNEGVHVEKINGEIMYRKINNGSTILYSQQLGRVIYALDPDNPVPEEDIPIVYDIYNNYLVNNMNRTVNQTTPKSDLQRLQEIIEWIDKHGYNPDINSEDTKEARKAIAIKKIQEKYKKYANNGDGFNNPRLSKSEIYEIQQIVELALANGIFDIEIGKRTITPGEKDLAEVQLFKITATQRKFLELYKDANKTQGNKGIYKHNTNARLNNIMNALETLNYNDIFISNELIKYGDTLKSVIEKCPEEKRQVLQEELFEYDEEYPIGQEYNFAKAAFLDTKAGKYFDDLNARNLYLCGIFEKIDEEFIKDNPRWKNTNEVLLKDDFIVGGRKNFIGINVKTGTIYDEENYDINGRDRNGCDRSGLDCTGLSEEEIKLAKNEFNVINIASMLLQKGIISEGQDIEEMTKIKDLLINAGYTTKADREKICSQLGIDEEEKIGEKLKKLKSMYNLEGINPSSKTARSYRKIFQKYSDKRCEMALLGIIPITKKGTVPSGAFKGETIQEYNDLMNKRKIENQKRLEEEKRKKYYNPSTGKKLDGTYSVEARNDRGFNPDRTYKDTGEYYDENGLDFEFRNKEGIDVRYGFGRDEYYYKKQEDGTYVNTGLKYNPMGFRADRRHVITKSSLDPRGFNIDGICRPNNDSIYDKNGYKQDGTYQETGELYHDGYNAYGVDIEGKDKAGKVHRDITFTQGYIDAIMERKRNTYLLQNYRNYRTNQSIVLADVDARVYKASQMYPKIDELLREKTKECIEHRLKLEWTLKKMQQEAGSRQEEIGKKKKIIEYYKSATSWMNPMER